MKMFLPLVALLAFAGCAEEAAPVEETAPVVEETIEPMMEEPMMEDSTMMEPMMEDEMMADTTAAM